MEKPSVSEYGGTVWEQPFIVTEMNPARISNREYCSFIVSFIVDRATFNGMSRSDHFAPQGTIAIELPRKSMLGAESAGTNGSRRLVIWNLPRSVEI
jgi:hypothetical protein